MNRLALCQRLVQEAGVSGTLSTTIGNTGSLNRCVTWIDQAWSELQTLHDDWDWLRSSNVLGAGMSFATVAGQASYPLGSGAGTCGVLASNFTKWARDTFRNYTTTVGVTNEGHLDEIPFDSWRNTYMFGANRNVQTRPVTVAIGPDQSVCLGPPPNALYTVTADYFTGPTVMTLDTDLPTGLPAGYHMMLVYSAMMMYAGYEDAPEVNQRGMAGYNLILKQIEAIRAPRIVWDGVQF
jgi:hypothetical protein